MDSNPALPRSVLAPSTVAVIGATEDRNKVGGRPIYYMNKFDYGGRVYPVNPRREVVQGLRCYATIEDLPTVPDMAVIAVGATQAAEAVRRCAKLGVGTAVLMSSGFGETGEPGRVAERALVESARCHGMRVVGPNCQGIANFQIGAVLNFSTMFMEVAPADGPIAIISQSGAASVVPYALLRERGHGVRYLIASGNDADLTVADLLGAVLDDNAVKVVLLYIETLGDVEKLVKAAGKARERGVALVALKPGSSAKGASAAASHTGALATEDAVVDAFFRRHGIWRVTDIHELVNAVPLYLSGRPPGTGRTLVLSHSGAVGVLSADAADRLGLDVPNLEERTRQRLTEIVPSFGSVQNPVDLTASLMADNGLFERALGVLAADQNIDVLHIGIPVAGEGYDIEGFASAAAATGRATGKPLLVSGPQSAVLDVFARQGVPTFRNDTDALRAVHQYARHCSLIAERAPTGSAGSPTVEIPGNGSGTLSEGDSLGLVRHVGIPVVEHVLCESLEEARQAFVTIGDRCVVKACSPDAPHKSEHGLVWLAIASEAQLVSAYEECRDRMDSAGIAGTVMVARMEAGRREMVVGAKRDPVLGPVILVGDGGKYIEVLRDYTLLTPPFVADDVIAALRSLRIGPILDGVRNEAPVDVAALAAIAVALGDLVLSASGIESVDLNPVIVKRAGEGAVVVDALVTLMPRPENPEGAC